MSDEAHYKTIAAELTANRPDPALWTQAFAETFGESDKTKALYIRLRLNSLKKSAAIAAEQTLPPNGNGTEASPNPALVLLRAALAKTLSERGASSFYSTLDLTPEADDASVARAIADLESRMAADAATPSPEFRYAKETLGNAKSREAYDRRLAEKFSNARLVDTGGMITASNESTSDSVLVEWWNSSRTGVFVGAIVIAVVGYVLLGFYRESGSLAIKKETVDVIRDASQAKAANDRMAIDQAAELRNRAAELAEREANRRQQEADRREFERTRQLDIQREREERRAEAEAERLKLAAQRDEERRVAKERKYWACMNQALNKMHSWDAETRCGGLRY